MTPGLALALGITATPITIGLNECAYMADSGLRRNLVPEKVLCFVRHGAQDHSPLRLPKR